MYRVLRVCAAAAFVVLGIVGCAGSGVSAKVAPAQHEVKDDVASLATDRWDALIRGDLSKAYEYLSPGTRTGMSLSSYITMLRPGKWRKATVDSVSCEQDRCNVVMEVQYDYREVKSIPALVHEVWLREDGKWWYVLPK